MLISREKHLLSTYLHHVFNGKIEVTAGFKIMVEKNSPIVPHYNGNYFLILFYIPLYFNRVANIVYILVYP